MTFCSDMVLSSRNLTRINLLRASPSPSPTRCAASPGSGRARTSPGSCHHRLRRESGTSSPAGGQSQKLAVREPATWDLEFEVWDFLLSAIVFPDRQSAFGGGG